MQRERGQGPAPVVALDGSWSGEGLGKELPGMERRQCLGDRRGQVLQREGRGHGDGPRVGLVEGCVTRRSGFSIGKRVGGEAREFFPGLLQ